MYKIYRAEGTVTSIRHAEVREAIACLRSRIGELPDWDEKEGIKSIV